MLIKIAIQMHDISDLPPDVIVCAFTQLTSKFCIILKDPQKNLRSSLFFFFFTKITKEILKETGYAVM